MRVEVDQSGKIGDTRVPTVLAFSDGNTYAIVIPAKVKRKCVHRLRRRGEAGTTLWLFLARPKCPTELSNLAKYWPSSKTIEIGVPFGLERSRVLDEREFVSPRGGTSQFSHQWCAGRSLGHPITKYIIHPVYTGVKMRIYGRRNKEK